MQTESSQQTKKVLLIIRDGWGYSPETEYNMIAQAHTPYTDMLEAKYSTTFLHASGNEVGIPEEYFGNSEVGHMTIGAGRVLKQSLLRIDEAIADESFFENKVLLAAIQKAKENNSQLHLIGLLQKEGVHASFYHLVALLEFAAREKLSADQVCIHIITDGRDAPKQKALEYIHDLEHEIARIGLGKIISFSGRYYAMDRNKNWERTEAYYRALMGKSYQTFSDIEDFFTKKYANEDFSDEFLEPTIYKNFSGIEQGDTIIFFNFRKDRARQLSHVFVDDNFAQFSRSHQNINFIAMTDYFDGIQKVIFPDLLVEDTLGEILEKNNKTQLRISETEKYAHVTFFFDGGIDRDFEGGEKIIIPSPDVATFDEKPEMSSFEITEILMQKISDQQPDCIICNFPNADMVGHTGNHSAIRKSVEAVDTCLMDIIPLALENDYVVMLTADHGNADYKHGAFETSHTMNVVPFTLISNSAEYQDVVFEKNMGLKNIAATICKVLGINIPEKYKKPLF